MANVTFKGNPLRIQGNEVQEGQLAPDFTVQAQDMSDYSLATDAGKTRILCAVPSLDTPVCDAETRRFNEEAARLGDVVVVCISMDLPMAQGRWCGAAGVENVKTGSDHREASFGNAYGCLIAEGPLARFLCRAVFVVGADNVLKHVQYVPEVAEEPDYDAVLAAVR